MSKRYRQSVWHRSRLLLRQTKGRDGFYEADIRAYSAVRGKHVGVTVRLCKGDAYSSKEFVPGPAGDVRVYVGARRRGRRLLRKVALRIGRCILRGLQGLPMRLPGPVRVCPDEGPTLVGCYTMSGPGWWADPNYRLASREAAIEDARAWARRHVIGGRIEIVEATAP